MWMTDFVYTLPMEIEAIWSRNVTGTSILYLVNRYAYGLSLIMITVLDAPGSRSDKR